MHLNPRFVLIGSLTLFCSFTIVGCSEQEDESYADCILSNSDKYTSDEGISTIKDACREKYPEPKVVEEPSELEPEPEEPRYKMLSSDELAKVKVTKNWVNSYVPGMANDIAHMASAQGAKLDWRISLQVENDLNSFIRAVQFELFTGGDPTAMTDCYFDMIDTREKADMIAGSEIVCEGLTAYNEIVKVNIPPQGLREVEISTPRDCCIVRVIGAITGDTEIE